MPDKEDEPKVRPADVQEEVNKKKIPPAVAAIRADRAVIASGQLKDFRTAAYGRGTPVNDSPEADYIHSLREARERREKDGGS